MGSDLSVGAPDPNCEHPAKPPGQAAKRSAKRRANRERIHARVVRPIDTPRLIRDPLERRESKVLSTLTTLRWRLGAVVIHGLTIVSLAFVNRLVGSQPAFGTGERLKVTIVEAPPPVVEPPPVEEAPAEQGPIEPEFTPPPVKDEPQTPPPAVKAEAPPTPAPEVVAPEPVQRRIVGLSLESTVQGEGPAFATGTSRMGQTQRSAQDPHRARAAPIGGAPVPSTPGTTQREATRIPTRDTAFEKPKRMRRNEPAYPATLKAQGIEGDVMVSVNIDESGRITKVSIVRSSGQAAFDRAAHQAATEERFSPAVRDGQPVAFTLTYSYRFRIED